MEFSEVVQRRASVRQFRPDPVDPRHVEEMVRLAGLAPSPNNQQPWRFVAISDRKLLARMGEAVRHKLTVLLPEPADEEGKRARARVEWFSTFFAEAPLVVAVAMSHYHAIVDEALVGSDLTHDDMNALRGRPDIQCIGAAVQNLLLAATDMGYGGCWLSGPLIARAELQQLLGLGAPWALMAMVAIGKAAAIQNVHRERKPLPEIFERRDG